MRNADDELHRSVVFDEISEARRLLEDGANPNYVGSEQTLLHSAIWTGIEMVDLLLQYGADPLLTNQFGERAFHKALQKENCADIANRLREFEPAGFHDEMENEKLARRFGAPESLIQRLSGYDLDLGHTDDETTLIRLLPLSDIYVFRFLKMEYLVLSCTILEQDFTRFYFSGPIVWCGKELKVCGIDVEHDTTCVVSDWDRFVSDTYSVVCDADYREGWTY